MSSSRVIEYLRRADFTAYESEAYLALLSKRELTAEEISRATSIPITRVYDTLEQLMQKGFARIAQGRPKKYHAIPPEQAKREYLRNLRQNFKTNLVTVDETLRHLQTLVEPIYVESHLQVKAEELLFLASREYAGRGVEVPIASLAARPQPFQLFLVLRQALDCPVALKATAQGKVTIFRRAGRVQILWRGHGGRKELVGEEVNKPLARAGVKLGRRELSSGVEIRVIGYREERGRHFARD